MRNPLKVIATVGLALGGVFGIAGTMVSPPLQAILWAIDGAGLVMATVLLTINCFPTGNDVVASGPLWGGREPDPTARVETIPRSPSRS